MKRTIASYIVGACLLVAPAVAADLDAVGSIIDTLAAPDPAALGGIDLTQALDYLDWEMLTVSLKADMTSINKTLGKTATVESVIYKKSITALRIDVRGILELNKKKHPLRLADCVMLRFPLKKKAFLLLPKKKRYMKLDPEKNRELLDKIQQKQDKRAGAKIHTKELLGREIIDGRMCEVLHIIMTTGKGIKSDITAWLARDLSGFPVKILLRFATPRGIEGTSTTLFTNIVKTEHDTALFAIPDDYEKYDTLLGLVAGRKKGFRFKKRRP